MLRVRTYLDRSATHGIGVFAAEDIAEGQLVWEFHPGIDITWDEGQWAELSGSAAPESMEQVRRYSYKEDGRYVVCIDNAQFMNHSQTQANVLNDRQTNTMRASRDIAQGEELLCNYAEYCDADDCNLGTVGGSHS